MLRSRRRRRHQHRPRAGGAGATIDNGEAGHGFYGGGGLIYGFTPTLRVGQGGAGGGGWYGGGASGTAQYFGGGGGGAGSSYVEPTNYPRSIAQETYRSARGHHHPGGGPDDRGHAERHDERQQLVHLGADGHADGPSRHVRRWARPTMPSTTRRCSAANFHALERCTEYSGPLTFSGGAHTLTYFSVDAEGLDEAVQTTSFAVTPTTTAGVTAASLGSGTNPTATAGGAAGSAGSVSVSGTGTGVVGAAVYGANPAGAPVFNSSGAYIDVIAAGRGLGSFTVLDCYLNGGTNVYWYTGTAWALVSNQTYDPATGCVTVAVNGTTLPTASQLAGTVFAAGSPPTTTAVATTADGKPYTASTWTNQSVTVAFTCTAGATPSAPVTLAQDAQNQAASGTCTDGLGQAKTTTFNGINVDKTPPSCAIVVDPHRPLVAQREARRHHRNGDGWR